MLDNYLQKTTGLLGDEFLVVPPSSKERVRPSAERASRPWSAITNCPLPNRTTLNDETMNTQTLAGSSRDPVDRTTVAVTPESMVEAWVGTPQIGPNCGRNPVYFSVVDLFISCLFIYFFTGGFSTATPKTGVARSSFYFASQVILFSFFILNKMGLKFKKKPLKNVLRNKKYHQQKENRSSVAKENSAKRKSSKTEGLSYNPKSKKGFTYVSGSIESKKEKKPMRKSEEFKLFSTL